VLFDLTCAIARLRLGKKQGRSAPGGGNRGAHGAHRESRANTSLRGLLHGQSWTKAGRDSWIEEGPPQGVAAGYWRLGERAKRTDSPRAPPALAAGALHLRVGGYCRRRVGGNFSGADDGGAVRCLSSQTKGGPAKRVGWPQRPERDPSGFRGPAFFIGGEKNPARVQDRAQPGSAKLFQSSGTETKKPGAAWRSGWSSIRPQTGFRGSQGARGAFRGSMRAHLAIRHHRAGREGGQQTTS